MKPSARACVICGKPTGPLRYGLSVCEWCDDTTVCDYFADQIAAAEAALTQLREGLEKVEATMRQDAKDLAGFQMAASNLATRYASQLRALLTDQREPRS